MNLGSGFTGVVVTRDTFTLPRFQKTINGYGEQMLLIGDEVHGMGSKETISVLKRKDGNFSLGLSATPERFDEAETLALYGYFGEIIYELSLKSAIAMGFLAEYEYFPILVDLNEVETQEYISLAIKIGRAFYAGGNADDEGAGGLGGLLGKRARLLGHCESKIPAFKKEVKKRMNLYHQLVYCADGASQLKPEDGEQVNQVLHFLGQEMGVHAQKYVQDTNNEQRRIFLERFSSGDDLQFIVAKKILDEGIDLPDARVAYLLASARLPRQGVQRRGRILRKPQNDPNKVAQIIDFLPLPLRGLGDVKDAKYERKLVEAEIARLSEFAGAAKNFSEIIGCIDEIRDRYGLGEITDGY